MQCQPGCYCPPNYVFSTTLNKCVPGSAACSCGVNEIYTCSSCSDSCNNYVNNVTCTNSVTSCTDGCYCSSGYARNASNICIQQTHCPSKYLNYFVCSCN